MVAIRLGSYADEGVPTAGPSRNASILEIGRSQPDLSVVFPGAWIVAKLFRACVGLSLLLAGVCAMNRLALAQDLAPAGSPTAGMRAMPPKPSEPPTDLLDEYKNDPLMLRALREQAQLRGEARQKQIVDATKLLLKIAQDLRNQLAAGPAVDSVSTEKDRLEQIQKLAKIIQDREKTEDDVSSDLAKAGVW